MNGIAIIERVLDSTALLPELVVVPDRGVTDAELVAEERLLQRQLSGPYKSILRRWNGLYLEVISLYGCDGVVSPIRRLSDSQLENPAIHRMDVVFASDPAGFVYLETEAGSIYSFDTKLGRRKLLADDMDSFIADVVFGLGAADFAGEDWAASLRDAGVLLS